MTSAPPDPRSHWPVPVGMISILYGLAYSGLSVGQHWHSITGRDLVQVALSAWIVAGGIGVLLQQSWGRVALLSGSYLLLAELTLVLCVVVMATAYNWSRQPDFLQSAYFVAVPLALAAWPAFLVIWLWRKPIRDEIQNCWN
jgi:hypothetical protein